MERLAVLHAMLDTQKAQFRKRKQSLTHAHVHKKKPQALLKFPFQ
jgi:hypothetical protein